MNKEQILEIFASNGIREVKIFIPDENDLVTAIVSREQIDGKYVPSLHAINNAIIDIEKTNLKISVAIVENNLFQIDTTLKLLLNHKYPDLFRNFFLSNNDDLYCAYIEPKKQLEDSEKNEIEESIKKFMRNFPKSKTTVFWIAPFNQPTKTKILNLVRLNSPVSLDTMFATLTQQGFLVPTKQHLSKTIDRFRKENLIIRRKDGGFILTNKAIHKLSTKINRESPDVKRILAKANQK